MHSAKSEPNFNNFIIEISDKLQQVTDTYLESYNEHNAFVYMIAELYRTTDPDKFKFTHGPKEYGIDFLIKDNGSYTICQCKCGDIEKIRREGDIPKYNRSHIEQLRTAIDMLLDKEGSYDLSLEIRRFKGDYYADLSNDPEGTNLRVILAILGELTDSAKIDFENYKKALQENEKHRIFLQLIDWKNIFHTIHSIDSPAKINFSIDLNFDDEKDLLSGRDYCYVLAKAFDFYEAFRIHEWNLFDWNVRYELHKSPVNNKIKSTLLTQKGRKKFHHLNNGILITCRSYTKDTTRKRLGVRGPQIINGCQTVRAICEAYEELSPSDQEHFRKYTKVQVKILITTNPEFIGELVISTNYQNQMNPRNLKSNSHEQRDLQKSFRNLPVKWFYERKDGEFKSLCSISNKVSWFKKRDYVGVISNENLAKAWYAFIGYSHKALFGGIKYFDDESGVYDIVFKNIPSNDYWACFSETYFDPDKKGKEYLSPGIPNVYQYLLAYGIDSYIKGRIISPRQNKLEAIKRGIERRDLEGDPETGECSSSEDKINEWLSKDNIYFRNIMISNMKEIFIELFAFILTIKYGTCDAHICKKIITETRDESPYFEKGFSKDCLPLSRQDGNAIFSPIYDFLVYCVEQYRQKYFYEIKAAPRLKSYFAKRDTVIKFRNLLIDRNDETINLDEPWKKSRVSFLDSLPSLDF